MSRLALFGGQPARTTMLPYGRHTVDDRDVEAVTAVLRSDWLTGGPKVGEFEEAFADRVRARHAIAFSSGTAALHAAVRAAGLGPGDEAITTPLTFCATANAVLYAGARPVFADVDPERLSLDPDTVAAIADPRTRALLPVDYAGHPAALDAMLALAERKDLIVIEDASHAVGARIGDRPIGSIAHMTTFSFHPVKHVACGEGGMVTTASDDLAASLRRFRNHGLTSEARDRSTGSSFGYDLVELGCNYRLNDLAAALGLSQLQRLDDNLARRREVAASYDRAFAGVLQTLPPAPGTESAWHLYPVRFDPSWPRDEIVAALRAEGIGVNVHYAPVPSLSLYRELGYRPEDCPLAAENAERLVSLPMFHGMTDRDVDDVVEAVAKVIEHYGP